MLIRTGLWTVEAAKSWLLNYEWGEAIANTLEDNPSPLRQAAWVSMIMDMEAVMCGSEAVDSAFRSGELEHVAADTGL